MKSFGVSRVKTAAKDAEAERLARRAEVKAKISKADAMRQQADALGEQLATERASIAALTDEHSAATAPLQKELASLESKSLKMLESGTIPDQAIDRRRAELFSEVAAENAKLEQAIDSLRKRFDPVHQKRQELLMTANAIPSRDRLAVPGIGCPKLLLKLFCARRRSHFAGVRREVARERLAQAQTELSVLEREGDQPWSGKDRANAERRRDEWTAEAEAAEAEQRAADEASAAIHEELKNE